jgi:hypothetical protein
MQGHRFEDHKDLLDGVHTTNEQAERFLEDDVQTLASRYRPHLDSPQLDKWYTTNTTNGSTTQNIARCQDFNTVNFGSATLQEEQERELYPKTVEQRQIERPAPMEAEAYNPIFFAAHMQIHC